MQPPEQHKQPATEHNKKMQFSRYKHIAILLAILAVAIALRVAYGKIDSRTHTTAGPVPIAAPVPPTTQALAATPDTALKTANNTSVHKAERSFTLDSAASTKQNSSKSPAQPDTTSLARMRKELKHADQLFKEQFYPTALEIYLKYVPFLNGNQLSDVGYIYGSDLGEELNYDEALKYYRMSAEKGNSYGNYNIGLYYKNGTGVKVDYKEAMKYFHKAAELQNLDAMVWIGNLHANGMGTAKDYNEALKWYNKAADGGNKEAFYDLGVFNEFGLGVTKDISAAIKYYQKAAAAGDPDAVKKLATLKVK